MVKITPYFDLVFNYDPEHRSYGYVFTKRVLDKLRSVSASGDCYFKISPKHTPIPTEGVLANASTVSVNEAKHTPTEIARARKARDLMARLYHPYDETMIYTLINGRSAPFVMGRANDKGPIKSNVILVPQSVQMEQSADADVLAW